MTKAKKKTKPAKPRGRGPGPVTNRRKQNEPLAPARGDKFRQRDQGRFAVDDPGPEDVTHFDAADFFDARAILSRDDE